MHRSQITCLDNAREFHSIKNDRELGVDKLPGIPDAIIPQWTFT